MESKGTSVQEALQMGQTNAPCFRTWAAMQAKWKAWLHSAVYIAAPRPVLTLPKHTPHVVLNLKLFLKKDNLSGDRGDEELEPGSDLGVIFVDLGVEVLHSSLGVSLWLTLAVPAAGADPGAVRHRSRLGVEEDGGGGSRGACTRGVVGLLPPDKNPSLAAVHLRGLGPGLILFRWCCFSRALDSRSRGMVVQNALLQPVPIFCAVERERERQR